MSKFGWSLQVEYASVAFQHFKRKDLMIGKMSEGARQLLLHCSTWSNPCDHSLFRPTQDYFQRDDACGLDGIMLPEVFYFGK